MREHLEEVQRRFVSEADTTRAVLRVRALQVAADLLETAQSETFVVRFIEFLVGDGKAPQVTVHVDVRAMLAPAGYAYPARLTSPGVPGGALNLIECEPRA